MGHLEKVLAPWEQGWREHFGRADLGLLISIIRKDVCKLILCRLGLAFFLLPLHQAYRRLSPAVSGGDLFLPRELDVTSVL